MDFLWTKGVSAPSFPSLRGDIKTDVLIIGGGIAGVLCALRLHEAGVDYVLAEGQQIGSGITKGTTAVLSAQHDTMYQDIINKFGIEKSKLYLDANLQALGEFQRLSRQIPCDFEEMPSVIYSQYDAGIMEQEARAVRQLGFPAEFSTGIPLPLPIAGAVRFPGMGQFHPLKFLYGAAKGLNIYENTFVKKLEGTTALTEKGIINAKKVIITSHFPFVNLHGLYFAKLHQQRSYVIALENGAQLGCTAMDAAKNGIYLRNYNNLLLVGGGDHRTGSGGEGFTAPRDFARKYFPNATELYAWANQDCVSIDGLPYVGPYSAGLPNVYVASGFNLWGMTNSMAASQILTDMVLGQSSPFAPAFQTDRSMLSTGLFSNMGTTFLGLIAPTAKRCPHMGCGLKWNAAEHSWDCPCHGSRFNEHGILIDNPAMRDSHVE